ncbi:hypothetical protein QQP08_021186 [Theobroma cacao]|nr:hypothetical protein QQP08_021186 [Theobroma cacao]
MHKLEVYPQPHCLSCHHECKMGGWIAGYFILLQVMDWPACKAMFLFLLQHPSRKQLFPFPHPTAEAERTQATTMILTASAPSSRARQGRVRTPHCLRLTRGHGSYERALFPHYPQLKI